MNKIAFLSFLSFFLINMNFAFSVCPQTLPEGLIMCFDFEDWTGDADTTPNYPYTTNYQEYWDVHTAATEVIANGDPDCQGDARSGNYYWHQQYQGSSTTPIFDPCGDITTGSIQGYNHIGANGDLPLNSGNDVDLLDDVDSDVMVTRFWFRTTDTWKNQVNVATGGNMGYHKFIRFNTNLGGDGGIIHFRVRDEPTTTFYIQAEGETFDYQFDSGIDLTDGTWHSITVKSVINDRSTGNITQTVWFDDWDMEGVGFSRTVIIDGFENSPGVFRANIIDNWSASYATTLMGIDIDDIEIWDRDPTQQSYENCLEGEITSTCSCNGEIQSSGFCCDGIWDENACRILSYGFEDWTGDADTTPGYVFTTSHWNDHLAATEVTGTCQGIEPANGNYYFHQQHYPELNVNDDPCLNSLDDPESPNPHTLIDLRDYTDDGNGMDEIFFSFSFQTNDEFGRLAGGYRNKWIELIGNTEIDGWAHFSSDGAIHMHEETQTDWHERITWPTGNPHGDGEWHTFAMYININTGEQSVWLDSTDWNNPTETRIYNYGTTTEFRYLVIDENFSALLPIASCWSKFDDIEIWNSIPGTTSVQTTCVNGQIQSCSTGLEGICSTGTQSCVNEAWGSCVQNNNPIVELCEDGIDQDCNGEDLACEVVCENDDLVCNSGCTYLNDNDCEVPDYDGLYQINSGDNWSYYANSNPVSLDWNDLGFNEIWEIGPSGFGYSDNDDATVLNDMQNSYGKVYIRKEFNLLNYNSTVNATLRVDYDDGFVAYVNGELVASGNMNQELSQADGGHEVGVVEEFDLSSIVFNEGNNVIAIVGYNVENQSSDFSLIPEFEIAYDVLEVIQYHPSDLNNNSIVEFSELISYVNEWKNGIVSFNELIDAIKLWNN